MKVDALVEEIRRGPSGPQTAVFFDFDGTLIDGYSAGALYSHRLRNFEIGLAEAFHTLRATGGGPLSEDQFVALMSRGIAGWAGRPVEDIDELGERLFSQVIAGTLFHEAWRVVKAHQRQGHTVALATSATRFQVRPLARELGIPNVLCTELESDGGLLTGRISGRTLWGPGKLAAVTAFAEARGLDLARAHGYANGDEDIPFLSAVGQPCAVNPQPLLAARAEESRWPVLRFRRGPGRLDPKPAIRTAAMYGTLIGAGAAGLGVGVLGRNRRRGIDLATSLFAHVAGAVGDVDVDVEGEQHLWSHRPAVFLINHQSALIDLLVTTTILRGGFTAVAKREAASVPVIGQLLTLADFAFVDRADSTQARAALQQAADRLAAGISIVISPEGTRSLTPTVGQFKKGGFHLAMQAGVPIVPIVIRNAGELMWRNARTARTGRIEVLVHEPIPTAGWKKADLDRAVIRVHDLYLNTLEAWPSSAESTARTAHG
ncbi:MAG: HAD-superfamily subfamily hydrolase [Frankiales bacterium]|jgi:putative phosphoserine phosphatase/1-acylglycerol-3-phosphate O-acyltransferase|nr:HAD-superfamily subfamily hydrolase [Frankiales bacterium]